MNVFDRITKSPQALADFLQAIPAINAPWDDAFHRIYCDQCAAENCDNCPNEALRGSALWYLTLPAEAALVAETRLPESFPLMMTTAVGLSLVYFLLMAAAPRLLTSAVAAVATVVILVLGLAPEETAREIIRKPWTSGQFVYSNQVIGRDVPGLGIKSELPLLAQKGLLATHPFTPEGLRSVTPENRLEAGRFIALSMCASCHSLTRTGIRPMNTVFAPQTSKKDIETYLGAGLYHGHTAYMPPLPLPADERSALAEFLHKALNSPDPAALVITGSDATTASKEAAK